MTRYLLDISVIYTRVNFLYTFYKKNIDLIVKKTHNYFKL